MEQPSAVGPNIFELGWQAESKQTLAEWAAANIRLRDSPYGEHFLLEETPWLIEPLETLQDPAVQETVVCACAQGGKTVMLHVALIFALDRKPGPTMFVAQTLDAVKDQATQKIGPMIESCPGLAMQLPKGKKRHNRSNRKILFPNATLVMGPANENFLRFYTIQWLLGDECSNWAPGKMEQARARTTRVWNRKVFFGSTPLEARSDFERAIDEGQKARFHLATACCGELVYLTSENLQTLFAIDLEKDWQGLIQEAAAGAVDWDQVREAVRLVCPKCGKKHRQILGKDEEGRWLYDTVLYRKMLAGSKYVAANPKASKEKRSYCFNVFCLPADVFGWGKIVELWLKAKAEELRGNLAPLKEFITLRLAETWDERKFLSVSLPNFEEYDPRADFPNEHFRALTVDCQEYLAEFHCVVRSWDKDGSSRLLTAATVHTEAEIQELQRNWGVKPHLVALDCGHERYRVFDMCLRNGWTAMRGDDRADWTHELDKDGRKVRRPFSPHMRGDPRNGVIIDGKNWCSLFDWSNPTIKDLLWLLKEGRGASWAVCDLGPEMSEKYAKWLDSERKREHVDRFGRLVLQWKKIRQNHFWDCECMQVVFAAMAKLFIFGATSEGEKTDKGGLTGEKDAEGRQIYALTPA